MPRVNRSFDASNREAALIVIEDPVRYECLEEWAELVLKKKYRDFKALNENDRAPRKPIHPTLFDV